MSAEPSFALIVFRFSMAANNLGGALLLILNIPPLRQPVCVAGSPRPPHHRSSGLHICLVFACLCPSSGCHFISSWSCVLTISLRPSGRRIVGN